VHSERFGEGRNFSSLLGIEPQFVCYPAHCLITILAARVTENNIIIAVHIL
jgi:hypothetical protein